MGLQSKVNAAHKCSLCQQQLLLKPDLFPRWQKIAKKTNIQKYQHANHTQAKITSSEIVPAEMTSYRTEQVNIYHGTNYRGA